MASAGNGTTPHLAGELFKMMTGVDMVHVPDEIERFECAHFADVSLRIAVTNAFENCPVVAVWNVNFAR